MSTELLRALSNGLAVEQPQVNQAVVIKAPTSGQPCLIPQKTDFVPVDMNNLIQANADIFEDTLTNGHADTQWVLIGCGIIGAMSTFGDNFGFSGAGKTLAISQPLVVDSFGASAKKISFLNFNLAGTNAIVRNLKVTSTNATQMSQALTTISINLNGEKYTSKRQFTEIDTDLNYAMLNSCGLPVSFFQGFLYPIIAGATVTLEMEFAGIGTTMGMSPKLMH